MDTICSGNSWNATKKMIPTITASQIVLKYASLTWDGCDLPTRILGFEVTEMGTDGLRDVENDWPALFYYYGYLGLALYAAFILYFIRLILKKLKGDFSGTLTVLNFSLGLALVLQLALAQFSGALVRRPNVSIYLSVILALIYYQTVRAANDNPEAEVNEA